MKITFGNVVSWIFGLLFISGGVINLRIDTVSALIYLLVGIFLIPRVRKRIEEGYDVSFSRWAVTLIAAIGYALTLPLVAGNLGYYVGTLTANIYLVVTEFRQIIIVGILALILAILYSEKKTLRREISKFRQENH